MKRTTRSLTPCAFCGKDQANLSRHITLKHGNVDEVKVALKLLRMLRLSKFDMFRKRGIFDQNKNKLVENEKDILGGKKT